MDKQIGFDPNGGPLWISIDMQGLYFITYTYQLWSADATSLPILTNPIRFGSNEIPHDDNFLVINDFGPTEPVANHRGRIIDVRFWVKKGDDDNGFNLTVTVLQGNSLGEAAVLDSVSIPGQVGELSIKEEIIVIGLI